jgi:hypothetical protein
MAYPPRNVCACACVCVRACALVCVCACACEGARVLTSDSGRCRQCSVITAGVESSLRRRRRRRRAPQRREQQSVLAAALNPLMNSTTGGYIYIYLRPL